MSLGLLLIILLIMLFTSFSTGACVLGVILLLKGSVGAGIICLLLALVSQRGRR